jgi:hypothetical protein
VRALSPTREGCAAVTGVRFLHAAPCISQQQPPQNSITTTPQHPAVLSALLPWRAGYGFSSAPKERGCGVTAMAGIMDSLMASLGYSKYIAQVTD